MATAALVIYIIFLSLVAAPDVRPALARHGVGPPKAFNRFRSWPGHSFELPGDHLDHLKLGQLDRKPGRRLPCRVGRDDPGRAPVSDGQRHPRLHLGDLAALG
jgi:hypothetical protein